MPFYDYDCARCGPFTAFRPMAEYEAPIACPDCGEAAPRILLQAPLLGGMDQPRLAAHATNERSAHAPRRSASGHAPGCGCCAGGKSAAAGKTAKRQKGFPERRPWMISH
ncbi:MAG TPA: zinc ribbon domain-containing protein [Stellaceae bacterium]|nr:zinc ribbon domain-containing protein [Stellaceae bacterium]